MKRKSAKSRRPTWVDKLDTEGQEFILGYALAKRVGFKYRNPKQKEKFMSSVRARFPGFVQKETIDIPIDVMNALRSLGFSLGSNAAGGKQKLPVSKARFISNVAITKEIMDSHDFLKAFPIAGGFLLTIFEGMYEDVALKHFGTLKLSASQACWTIGTILISIGRLMRQEKSFDFGKGRANSELLTALKTIRSHQKKRIMPKEIKQILEVMGIHVPDAETLRIFEWRARKKGQL